MSDFQLGLGFGALIGVVIGIVVSILCRFDPACFVEEEKRHDGP